jgi:hypothetical protein
VRFRIHAARKRGPLPNWWSRVGFRLLARRYQRAWHQLAQRTVAPKKIRVAAHLSGLPGHDFRSIDPFREKANPPIDLAQPPLAVLIVGVFAAIAVAAAQATSCVTAGRSLVSRNCRSSLSRCKPLGVM